jgi:hypothetical protein
MRVVVDGTQFDLLARALAGEDGFPTLEIAGTVVAVGALVSVAIDDPAGGPPWPFLFLPDDFSRHEIAPRMGDRWMLTLAVDLEGRELRGVRLVGLTPA